MGDGKGHQIGCPYFLLRNAINFGMMSQGVLFARVEVRLYF